MKREYINPEYILESATLFVLTTALMPWAFFYAVIGDFSRGLFLYFLPLEIRYFREFDISLQFFTPYSGYTAHASNQEPVTTAYIVWIAGTIVFLATVLIVIGLFINEQWMIDTLPVHPANLLGGLLGGSGVILSIAAVLMQVSGAFGGIPVPVGSLFMIVFGGVLLVNPIKLPKQENN